MAYTEEQMAEATAEEKHLIGLARALLRIQNTTQDVLDAIVGRRFCVPSQSSRGNEVRGGCAHRPGSGRLPNEITP